MQVWTLMKGEMHEGGSIIGIYADRDLARGQFATEAQNMHFGIDGARQDDDGSIHLEAGCDWLSLEPHDVINRAEIDS